MKKLVAFLLVLAVVLGFSACGEDDGDGKKDASRDVPFSEVI